MAIRDEALEILREELGEGFESAAYAQCRNEHMRRYLAPKIKARRRRRIDTALYEAARIAAEESLEAEREQIRLQEQAIDAQIEVDLEGL